MENTPDVDEQGRPIRPCGAAVCGMHPAHIYTHNRVATHCPGHLD